MLFLWYVLMLYQSCGLLPSIWCSKFMLWWVKMLTYTLTSWSTSQYVFLWRIKSTFNKIKDFLLVLIHPFTIYTHSALSVVDAICWYPIAGDVLHLYLLFSLEAHSRPSKQEAYSAKRQNRKPLPEGGQLQVRCSHLHMRQYFATQMTW